MRQDYSYDKIGQLVKVGTSRGNSSVERDYKYDAAWNLTYRTNTMTLQTFGVDNKNQLTQVPPDGNSGVNGNGTPHYDGNGNISDDGLSQSFTYDDENRMVSWGFEYEGAGSNNPGTEDMRIKCDYDGLGRLRTKRAYVDWGGTGSFLLTETVNYIYDGMRVIQERDASNVPTVSYTRGTDLSGTMEGAGGIGGLLGRSHGYSGGNWSTHNFYHADGNGNITYLVNSSQALAASYQYDAFGNTLGSSGEWAPFNHYRFSSKEIEPESGLYYYGYRFYAPNLQRWLTRDPISEWGDLNIYRFCRNSPQGFVDSIGLQIGMPPPPPVPGVLPVGPFPGGIAEPVGPMGRAWDLANYELGHLEYPESPEEERMLRHRPTWPPQNCPGIWSMDPPSLPPPNPNLPVYTPIHLPPINFPMPTPPPWPGGGCSLCRVNNPSSTY